MLFSRASNSEAHAVQVMLHTLQRICIAILVIHAAASGSFDDVTRDNVLGSVSGTVAALGDWNSDHYVDTVVARKDEVTVYSGDGGDVLEQFMLQCTTCIVSNVILGDMNYDGLMDVLVQYQYTPEDPYLQNTIFFQPPNDGPLVQLKLPLTTDHFLAVNLFGRLYIDLVGTLAFNASDDVTTRSAILRNDGCEDDEQGCLPRFDCLLNTTNVPPADLVIAGCSWVNSTSVVNMTLPLEQPFSKIGDHGITDLDGDCSPDVVLSLASDDSFRELMLLETVPNKTFPFTTLPSIKVASEVGFITWYDVDQDGDMDMIAPLCNQNTCQENGLNVYDSVVTIKNLQTSPGCSGYSCCKKRSFAFPDIGNITAIREGAKGKNVVITKLGGVLMDGQYSREVFGAGSVFPQVVRLGDVENDGDVDIILTVTYEDMTTVTEIWTGSGEGGFTLMGHSANAITKVTSSRAGFFYDLGKDGTLDVMVLSVDKSGNEKIHVLENNIHETNHLFFKTLGLNGRCFRKCSSKPTNPDPKPYGVNMPGASHKIFFKVPRTMSSRNVYSAAVQLSQSQFLSLQNPFFVFWFG
eukprot:TRINITY_DN6709_c0_g2_i7.p1 TRINITY_DN6709_c0_g2~~TRINITY_DN6709_c0_g2_i7.p1  ORF type:complete len:579 (+),score=141.52 TRINITY_DN6709_c0_g2_i7:1367-3103(+)